jgi:hypothetical protein
MQCGGAVALPGSANGRSSAAKMTSGQARASLELVDGVPADFETAGQLQRDRHWEVDRAEAIATWLAASPRSRRPTDEIRFRTSVYAIAKAAGIEVMDISSLLDEGRLELYLAAPGDTPIQAVSGSCRARALLVLRFEGSRRVDNRLTHGRLLRDCCTDR